MIKHMIGSPSVKNTEDIPNGSTFYGTISKYPYQLLYKADDRHTVSLSSPGLVWSHAVDVGNITFVEVELTIK